MINEQDRFNIIQEYEESKGREGQYVVEAKRKEIDFIPIEGEILHTYIRRIARAIEQLDEKAWQQHTKGNRMWFCHKNVMGCFICQHTQLLYILRNSFKALSEVHNLSDYKYTFLANPKDSNDNHPQWIIIPI